MILAVPARTRPPRFGLPLLAVALCAGGAASAQPVSESWNFTVGVGAFNQPEYPGSDRRETRAVPILGAAYGRYFIGGVPGAGVPFGLGAYLLQTERWRFGAALGGNLSNPREESDSSRLRGLGDIERTALASAFGSFTEGWFTARGAVITDIGGEDQGTRVSLDLEGRYSLTPALSLSAGPGLTWADGDYTQTFFGIDATQSARSGRPIYRADSGLNTLRFSLGADYRLTPQWSVSARAVASSLRGDAEDSPITETSSQNLYSVFLSYRF